MVSFYLITHLLLYIIHTHHLFYMLNVDTLKKCDNAFEIMNIWIPHPIQLLPQEIPISSHFHCQIQLVSPSSSTRRTWATDLV